MANKGGTIPTIGILGCGPAGLFAAQAVRLHGFEPVIISKKRKSVIYGAQYLHKPIPGITDKRSAKLLKTFLRGREDRYAERVYGVSTAVTSWRKVVPAAPVWDLRESYEKAWEQFHSNIVNWTVAAEDIKEFTETFELVVSTIPLWTICSVGHTFQSISILFRKDIPSNISYEKNENFVIYNGTEEGDWYRISHIFGCKSTEARSHPKLVEEGDWMSGYKVVGNNCDCHPGLVRAGRMGKWVRGELTHNAFETAAIAISDRFSIVLNKDAGCS